MSDAAKDAFKLGFLTRCAEEGLVGAALTARIAQLENTAPRRKAAFDVTGAFKSLGGLTALGYGLPIALSGLGGGVAGYGAAKLMEPNLDPEQIKAEELAHTYRVYADRLRANRKIRQYRANS